MNDPHLDPTDRGCLIGVGIMAAAVVAIIAILAFSGNLKGAPAPFPRKPAPSLVATRLVGTWVVRWGYTDCTVTLAADGGYECKFASTHYVGYWNLVDGWLCWRELPDRPPTADEGCTYRVRLDPRTLSGRLESRTLRYDEWDRPYDEWGATTIDFKLLQRSR